MLRSSGQCFSLNHTTPRRAHPLTSPIFTLMTGLVGGQHCWGGGWWIPSDLVMQENILGESH